MINQSDKRFMLHSKTTECTSESLSSHSLCDFWLRCWKDQSSGICSKPHASRVTILEFLTKISCNLRENSRVIPASSTQNSCEFGGFVAWKKWNIHTGHLKIRSFPTIVLYVFLDTRFCFTYSNMVFSAIKAGNSKVNIGSPPWPNFEHVRFYACSVYRSASFIKIRWKMKGLCPEQCQQSRANNSKVTGLIRPEFKFIWDLKPLLVTCKFGDDPINNECASLETAFFHYSLWEIFPVLRGM